MSPGNSSWRKFLLISKDSEESAEITNNQDSAKANQKSSGKKYFNFYWNGKNKAIEPMDEDIEDATEKNLTTTASIQNIDRERFTFEAGPFGSPVSRRSMPNQRSLASFYNEKSTDSILLPDGRLLHGRIQKRLTIDTSVFAPLISPISPLTVQQRAYFIAQSGNSPITDFSSPLSPSGPRLFVPEGGPREATVGRFTINRESVESSFWKPPSLDRRLSRFSSGSDEKP